jgi:hypothetical protein
LCRILLIGGTGTFAIQAYRLQHVVVARSTTINYLRRLKQRRVRQHQRFSIHVAQVGSRDILVNDGPAWLATRCGLAKLSRAAEGINMKTDQLIRTLVADNNRQARSVGSLLTISLAAGGMISTIMFFSWLGFRHDIDTAIYEASFDLKFLLTISLLASTVLISIHLSRPEASLDGWKWLLLIPFGFLAVGIAGDLMLPQRLPWMARLIGSNSKICTTAIPVLSLPVLIAVLIALRHGAPSRPALAGAFAGLLSAGFAATLYASQCTDDSPLFVATWYSAAIAAVGAVGALVGGRVLRF